MSRRDNWEAEDGMGFAGLVPSAAEKSQERYEERQRQQVQELHEALAASQRENQELRERLERAEKDTKRLDWMIENEGMIAHAKDGDCCWLMVFDLYDGLGRHGMHSFNSAREAIDDALTPAADGAASGERG